MRSWTYLSQFLRVFSLPVLKTIGDDQEPIKSDPILRLPNQMEEMYINKLTEFTIGTSA